MGFTDVKARAFTSNTLDSRKTIAVNALCHDSCETEYSVPIPGVGLLHARAPALDVVTGKARHLKRRSV